jgi:GNAT superfamily N-acetyltransferase
MRKTNDEFWEDFFKWAVEGLKKKFGVDLVAELRTKKSKILGDRKYLFIAYLEVPKAKRGTGVGSKVLNSLCDFADCRGYPMSMVPFHKDSDLEALVKFYKKFGFIENPDKRKLPGTLIRYSIDHKPKRRTKA